MNETLKYIRERFACRSFTDEKPTSEQIGAIAQAAIQSPSGMNRQHWHISVVESKELISEIEEEGIRVVKATNEMLAQRIASRNNSLFYNAPCVIFIAIKKPDDAGSELIDLGIISQNIVIAATSLGLGSLHCGLAAFAFAGDKKEYFKNKLSFPEGYENGIAVLIGHAAAKQQPHEPDQSKITFC